jgi:Putative transmembrane protein (Alph_Pro_TM)
MHRFVLCILLCCAGLIMGSAGPARCDEPAELTVSPSVMSVDTFFSGGQVTISGEIQSSDEVVIEVAGPEVNSLYDLKGRVGPFWMTREKVQLAKAPGLYMLLLPQGQDWEQKAALLGLGVEHLKKQIAISGSDLPADDVFRMFVSLKSSEGLYGETPGAILYTPGQNGHKRFTATYLFPAATTGGKYTVKATIIENGSGGLELSREVTVQEVGFVKMVNDLASNQRLTYGVAAVVIALAAGALMGLIFKRGGSH